jgi:hypothetical protein
MQSRAARRAVVGGTIAPADTFALIGLQARLLLGRGERAPDEVPSFAYAREPSKARRRQIAMEDGGTLSGEVGAWESVQVFQGHEGHEAS